MARNTMLVILFVVSLLGFLRAFLLPGAEDFAILQKEGEALVDAEVSRMIELFAAQDREMTAVQRRREGLLKGSESYNDIYHGYAQELTDLQEVANDVAGNVRGFAEVVRAQEELTELQNQAIFLSRQKLEQRGATDKKCIPSVLVEEETEHALRTIVADGTGMADFANVVVGGTLLQNRRLTSRTFTPKAWWMSSNLIHWLGFDNGIGPIESVISPNSSPGRCWAMEGSKGQVSIQLAREIRITRISIEHSSRSSVAPRDFEVYGLRGHETPVKLLEGGYDLDGPSIQTFPTEMITDRFPIVQFRFINNWGNEQATCIYRLRVHGEE